MAHTHETGIFKNVHSAAISLAQATRVQQPPATPEKPASSDVAHEEHSSVFFGEHLEKLQEAGRAAVKTVKTAFDKGRRPTTDDVLAITAKLDKVAAAAVAGKHATANNSKCDHNLTEFLTEEDAFLKFQLAPLELRRDIAALGFLKKIQLGEPHPDFEGLFPKAVHVDPPGTRLGSRRHGRQFAKINCNTFYLNHLIF